MAEAESVEKVNDTNVDKINQILQDHGEQELIGTFANLLKFYKDSSNQVSKVARTAFWIFSNDILLSRNFLSILKLQLNQVILNQNKVKVLYGTARHLSCLF